MYLQAKPRLFLKQKDAKVTPTSEDLPQLVGYAARPLACRHAHVGDRGNAQQEERALCQAQKLHACAILRQNKSSAS